VHPRLLGPGGVRQAGPGLSWLGKARHGRQREIPREILSPGDSRRDLVRSELDLGKAKAVTGTEAPAGANRALSEKARKIVANVLTGLDHLVLASKLLVDHGGVDRVEHVRVVAEGPEKLTVASNVVGAVDLVGGEPAVADDGLGVVGVNGAVESDVAHFGLPWPSEGFLCFPLAYSTSL